MFQKQHRQEKKMSAVLCPSRCFWEYVITLGVHGGPFQYNAQSLASSRSILMARYSLKTHFSPKYKMCDKNEMWAEKISLAKEEVVVWKGKEGDVKSSRFLKMQCWLKCTV
jgi:hypothetical protein